MSAPVAPDLRSLLPLWLTGAAALPAGLLFLRSQRRARRELAAAKRREAWGLPVEGQRDLDTARAFSERIGAPPGDRLLDDASCRDLDLHALFEQVDRTLTNPGEWVLYRQLRAPCMDPAALRHMDRGVQQFSDDQPLRERVIEQLARLGRVDHGETLQELLWEPLEPPDPHRWLYASLALAAVGCVAGMVFAWHLAILPLLLVFLVNMAIHYQSRARLQLRIPCLRTLCSAIQVGRDLSRMELPGLEPERERLHRAAAATRRIRTKGRMINPERGGSFELQDMLHEYVSVLLLLDVRSYHAMVELIRTHIEPLRELMLVIGRLDAWQSVASYRAGLDGWSKPDLRADTHELRLVDAVHPLVADPVPNSITLGARGTLITGCNMSGKSTFLRTVGINALMAQTLYTTTTASYRGGCVSILCSISSHDSLAEGKSFYFVEAERLLSMVRAAEAGDGPVLCLIDELLRGTNTTERLAASREILAFLQNRGALVLVATHDFELADELADNYDSYHFTDHPGDGQLEFDYRLRDGVAVTRNAIRLLEQMGYPRQIVERAAERAQKQGLV